MVKSNLRSKMRKEQGFTAQQRYTLPVYKCTTWTSTTLCIRKKTLPFFLLWYLCHTSYDFAGEFETNAYRYIHSTPRLNFMCSYCTLDKLARTVLNMPENCC